MNRKRLFDLLLTTPGLLLLSPLLAGVSLWIKWGSKGPVFFTQTRIGLHGKPFQLIKFRTMVPDAEALGLQLTTGEDPRITRPGLFLRRYKLDELPQLFNVLKGEMSLVGPRPEVPRYVAEYPEEQRALVLSVPPGITETASIEFRDENSLLDAAEDPERVYLEQILPVKLRYGAEYARTHTLGGDVRIILRTLQALIS